MKEPAFSLETTWKTSFDIPLQTLIISRLKIYQLILKEKC